MTITLHRDDLIIAVTEEARSVGVDVVGVEVHGHVLGVKVKTREDVFCLCGALFEGPATAAERATGQWSYVDLTRADRPRHDVTVQIQATGGAW